MPRPKPSAQEEEDEPASSRHRAGRASDWARGNYHGEEDDDEDDEGDEQDCNEPASSSAVEFNVKLGMWDLGQCDKKRCTGTRMVHQRICKELKLGVPFPGVILSPAGTRCVSREDAELIRNKGLAVVDCSWNRLDDVPFNKIKGAAPRLLPFLVAANPVNYGKVSKPQLHCFIDLVTEKMLSSSQAAKLSCAEAFAAALYICGLREEAVHVMSRFKWGHSFFSANAQLLDAYGSCQTAAGVIATQNEWRKGGGGQMRGIGFLEDGGDEEEIDEDAQRRMNREMPPSESSSEYEGEDGEDGEGEEDGGGLSHEVTEQMKAL